MAVENKQHLSEQEKELNQALRAYVRDLELPASSSSGYRKKITYKTFFQNKFVVIRSIRRGVPYPLFHRIKEVTPFTENDWAEYLNLSVKTLHRYRSENQYFKPIHSEKILELAEVTRLGKEVFDSADQFYSWLNMPSIALGNMKPAELLKDSYGKELVMSELNRIEHGIFV